MRRDRPFSLEKTDLLGLALSILVVIACLYYCRLYLVPDVGFTLDMTTWQVRSARPCADPPECLQVGDQVLAIGEVTREDYAADRTLAMLSAFERTGAAPVRILRDGRERTLLVRVRRGPGALLHLSALNVFFPLLFWSVGTAAVLFLRPRDERWWVLVLFYYLTALWFASGLASAQQAGYSAVVFHAVIWLFVPLIVHLHLILPRPLLPPRPTRVVLVSLYGASLVMLVADLFELLARRTYLTFLLAAVLVALALLLVRFFLRLPPAAVVANRIMSFGVVLGFAPLLLFFVLPVLLPHTGTPDSRAHPFYPWAALIPLLTIPIWPLSYIYAIYKHRLGTLELRANRLLSVYSFYSLYVTSYVVVLLLIGSFGVLVDGRAIATTLGTSLLFVAAAPLLRRRFQALVDRHVFGVKHSPEEVIGLVAERVPRAFDRAVLARTIVDEVLPTLLIRQSALYLLGDGGEETLYTQAVPGESAPPDASQLAALARVSGEFLPRGAQAPPFDWVRLVVPLSVQEEVIGFWLIGRRDPDDHFPRDDIRLLSTLANQIAPVVENIRLYEQAQLEIAQRRAAEEAIRKSEERFRNLFEATLEGIAIVRGGVILEVNRALGEIFGYAPSELIGRPLSDLVPGVEIGPGGGPREGTGSTREGAAVEVEIAVESTVFQGEDVTVVAVRDITRRKRDEAENKRLQQQLLQAQKMEAIGRLSAGVAHDFNNCLLAIFGYSDLLLGSAGDDEFLRRNVGGIKEAGQKAAALTKQLLAFTRQQPMAARVMDLNEVVAGIEKMLRRLIGEDVHLATHLAPGLPPVEIDPGQMEQVILNLAVNARDAMPDGGKLTLATSLAPVAGSPERRAEVPAGTYVLLAVEDAGVGMDAETRARAFEPFFSTKEVGQGTGLGLSTAYGIVKQSGGYILIDSSPGAGARFSIYLPAVSRRERDDAAPQEQLADSGSETILLVEDEDEARTVLRQILAGKGYSVLEARTGKEALALAARADGPLDLLLTDVTMPGMRGTELAARLLGSRSAMRVLYMSGYSDEPLEAGSGAAPVCLQKPFSAEALTRAVREVLDRR